MAGCICEAISAGTWFIYLRLIRTGIIPYDDSTRILRDRILYFVMIMLMAAVVFGIVGIIRLVLYRKGNESDT